MSTVFTFVLSVHVLLGVLGLIATYAVLLLLLKRSAPIRQLRIWSVVGFVSYILSWFSGGYYYVLYYGDNIKPLIKGGPYPWAHSVFMETKEHVFLTLPFAVFVLALVLLYKAEDLNTNQTLKRNLVYLAVVITVVATGITLSGIIISGAR